MKLPGEKFRKNFNSTNTYNNSSANNENIIYRTSSIKGNLFRNTSRTMRFQMADPFANSENKTIKFKNFYEKRTTQDNMYKENQNNNIEMKNNENDINSNTHNFNNKVNENDLNLNRNKNENINNINNEKDSNTSLERNYIPNNEKEYFSNNRENLPMSSKTQFNFFNQKTLMENSNIDIIQLNKEKIFLQSK